MNMREGSLWDKILWYAIPLALTGILQQLFNAADIAMVGRFVGANAMAAVGSNTPLMNLLLNLFVGISLGTNVVIANSIGRRDVDTIRKTVHTSIIVSVVSGLAVAVVGELIAVPALHMMGVPPEVFDLAVLYFRIYMAHSVWVFYVNGFILGCCLSLLIYLIIPVLINNCRHRRSGFLVYDPLSAPG